MNFPCTGTKIIIFRKKILPDLATFQFLRDDTPQNAKKYRKHEANSGPSGSGFEAPESCVFAILGRSRMIFM